MQETRHSRKHGCGPTLSPLQFAKQLLYWRHFHLRFQLSLQMLHQMLGVNIFVRGVQYN